MMFANVVSFILADVVLPHVPNATFKNTPWNRPEWRKIARAFIGDQFTPKELFPHDEAQFQHAIQDAAPLPPAQKQMLIQTANARKVELLLADNEWLNWYFILRNYPYYDQTIRDVRFGHQMVYLYHACSLAGLTAIILIPDIRNWFLWFLFIFGSLFGFAYPFAVKFSSNSLPQWDNVMAGQMLRIVHRDAAKKP